MTEPNATTETFLIYGSREDHGVLVYLDFSQLHQRQCSGYDAPDTRESDYQLWAPKYDIVLVLSSCHRISHHRHSFFFCSYEPLKSGFTPAQQIEWQGLGSHEGGCVLGRTVQYTRYVRN